MSGEEFFRIDLLRHGETQGGARFRGVTDDPLTANGWQQMWRAVNDDAPWNTIVTSPLRRCADFAGELAQRLRIPLRVEQQLGEMDFGAWEGRNAEELMATEPEALEQFWRDPSSHGPPRGEPLTQLQARVLAAWRDVVSERRATLVVSHGGPIRVILCHIRELPSNQLLSIDVPHASLHRLRVGTQESSPIETNA